MIATGVARGHLPNEAAVVRLAGAVLLEAHNEWQIAERRCPRPRWRRSTKPATMSSHEGRGRSDQSADGLISHSRTNVEHYNGALISTTPGATIVVLGKAGRELTSKAWQITRMRLRRNRFCPVLWSPAVSRPSLSSDSLPWFPACRASFEA